MQSVHHSLKVSLSEESVVVGLALLAGLVVFIGTVTGESAHQPSPAKDEVAKFRYTYTASFLLLTIAFSLDELAGVLAVYVFIIRLAYNHSSSGM